MNRRNFFGAMGAVGGTLALGRNATTRHIKFAPPKEPPNIYYITGHDKTEMLLLMLNSLDSIDVPVELSQIKEGWASFKLNRIGIYLSDRPLENFEPITYWIPAGQNDQEVTQ